MNKPQTGLPDESHAEHGAQTEILLKKVPCFHSCLMLQVRFCQRSRAFYSNGQLVNSPDNHKIKMNTITNL